MKHLFAFLALALICLNTWAISSDLSGVSMPSTVYLYDAPRDISIKIVNEEETAQDYSIQFNAPTQFELSQANGTIAGQKSKTITLTLFPRSDLTGQTYETQLAITLGNEKYIKKLRIVFREAEEQNNSTEETPETPTGFFALFAMPALTTELLINLVLVFIAAVLLIAFIARFVKRMEGK